MKWLHLEISYKSYIFINMTIDKIDKQNNNIINLYYTIVCTLNNYNITYNGYDKKIYYNMI